MPTQIEFDTLDVLRQINKTLNNFLNNTDLNCTRPTFVWSIEHKPDLVVIKYNYQQDFSCFIKNIRLLHWDEFNNWWYAHKDFSDEIHSLIKSHFPEWKCIDKR